MEISAERHAPRVESPSPEALEFVRYCYGRRRVPWPELYDEMCAVAARGLFRGWGFDELAEHGIGFSLSDLPRLASLVGAVARAETDGRGREAPAAQPGPALARFSEPLAAR